jgi:hypothetical protein
LCYLLDEKIATCNAFLQTFTPNDLESVFNFSDGENNALKGKISFGPLLEEKNLLGLSEIFSFSC